MNALIIAVVIPLAYLIAYFTYGRFLGEKIFRVAADRVCPSHSLRDDVDFVPTNKHVLFGHHFTSIAGLGGRGGHLGLDAGGPVGAVRRHFHRSRA